MKRLKIYFACSIRGGGDASNYRSIVESINRSGGTCLSEIFVNDAIELGGSMLPEDEIYQRDIKWIKECDAMIAEVSNPSLGVGYEIAFAESLNKPILALWDDSRDSKLSAMVQGNPTINVVSYTSTDDLSNSISEFLKTPKA